MTKGQKLVRLRGQIIDEVYKKRWEKVWFYPKYNGVMGWCGVGDIMFLALNPSTGTFGGFYDALYYNSLRKFKFKNAHLTDVFKLRKTNKEAGKSFSLRDRKEAKRFLEKEIEIIKPRLIVFCGKKTEKHFKEFFPNIKIKNIRIGHYAYRYGSKTDLRERWRREMQKVEKKYKEKTN